MKATSEFGGERGAIRLSVDDLGVDELPTFTSLTLSPSRVLAVKYMMVVEAFMNVRMGVGDRVQRTRAHTDLGVPQGSPHDAGGDGRRCQI